ncbi:MAG: CmcJ/NvfI family oxidoreductase [Myxococcota bacterium]
MNMHRPVQDARAALNYLKRTEQRPTVSIDLNGVPGVVERVPRQAVTVDIHDARGGAVTFAESGVALVHAPSRAGNLREDAALTTYGEEIAALLKERIGAIEVEVFDHTLRFEAAEDGDQRTPVYSIHYDYTNDSGAKRLRDLLSGARADAWAAGHYGIVNVWRPVERVVMRSPLAFVDEKTTTPDDRGVIDIVYTDRVGHNYGLHHRDGVRMFFFPEMTPEEAVMFKTFDSDPDAAIRYVGHTAFEDLIRPNLDAPARQSVETRALVRWK